MINKCKQLPLTVLLLIALLQVSAQSNKPTSATSVATSAKTAYKPSAYSGGVKVNHVRSWQTQQPYTSESDVKSGSRTPEEVGSAIVYIDALGRQLQTVGKQSSPTKKDMVSAMVYDDLGRQSYQFLPYTDTGNSGIFKTDPFGAQSDFYSSTYPSQQPAFTNEKFFYSKVIFETSPSSMPLKNFAPGNSWVGTEGDAIEHSTQSFMLANMISDSVLIWKITNNTLVCTGNDSTINIPTTGGYYAAGQLMKSVGIDEEGHSFIAYKDKAGQLVLKKTQEDTLSAKAYKGWLCTYYVYDIFGQLRFMIPPKAVEWLAVNSWTFPSTAAGIINELCFRYEYDARHRPIAKKTPGQGWGYMVYDKRDRLVFTQNTNTRTRNQWGYVLYDALNRPVQSGIMNYGISSCSLQTYVDSVTGNYSYGADTVYGGITSPVPEDIIYNEAIVGKVDYFATNSIELVEGFSSPDSISSYEIVSDTTARVLHVNISILDNPLPTNDRARLTITQYDDYSEGKFSYYNGYNSRLTASGSGVYADSLPTMSSIHTKGMVTRSCVRVIDNPNDIGLGNWLETNCFYDEKGRMVEAIKSNYKGGSDTVINRFSYTGQSICNYTIHNNPTTSTNSIRIKTNLSYDHAGRPLSILKQLNDDTTTNRLIARYSYDALGKVLHKKIGQKNASDTSAMEDDVYSYNIRGWLQGINADQLGTTATSMREGTWFSMSLNYDWGFDSSLFNGNIAGMKWQSRGDEDQRAYGFGYDAVGRLLYADFNQKFSSTWAKTDGGFNIDFSMLMGDGIHTRSAYDANGNILALQRKGLQLNSSNNVDSLTYSYASNSNRLMSVADGITTAFGLGDFVDKNTSGDDYTYDSSGNMLKDKNKHIDSIFYNQQNLPYKIIVKKDNGSSKGTISYLYDAAGNKLEKTTIVDSTSRTTTTGYMGGFIYQNNNLQFFGHEEGRTRPVNQLTSQPANYSYDYCLKDHLGNTRVVLTDERKQDVYPAVTLEDGSLAIDTAFYSINPANIVDTGTVHVYNSYNGTYSNNNGFTNPNTGIDPNATSAKMYKLNGASGSKTGLGITLKVMSGDTVNIFGKMFWKTVSGTTLNNSNHISSALINLLGSIAGSAAVAGSGKGGTITGTVLNGTSTTTTPLSHWLDDSVPTPSTKPKAYINWILFDEHFRPVNTSSGFESVSDTSGKLKSIYRDINIYKNGYLYIYCSNESNLDVFFDNLQVVHAHGPLIEETHYYPFGMNMTGISSKASGSVENKYKYNSSTELNNDLDINLYETSLRGYDAQLGRFAQSCDPLAAKFNSLSNYAFVGNNPIKFSDPSGAEQITHTPEGVSDMKAAIKECEESQACTDDPGCLPTANEGNLDWGYEDDDGYGNGRPNDGIFINVGGTQYSFENQGGTWGFYNATGTILNTSTNSNLQGLTNQLTNFATTLQGTELGNRFNDMLNNGFNLIGINGVTGQTEVQAANASTFTWYGGETVNSYNNSMVADNGVFNKDAVFAADFLSTAYIKSQRSSFMNQAEGAITAVGEMVGGKEDWGNIYNAGVRGSASAISQYIDHTAVENFFLNRDGQHSDLSRKYFVSPGFVGGSISQSSSGALDMFIFPVNTWTQIYNFH